MSEDLQEYLDQLETVQTELLDDPENAELVTLRDELLELIQLLQDDTNADDDQEEDEESGNKDEESGNKDEESGDKNEVVAGGNDKDETEKADGGVIATLKPPASVSKPPPPPPSAPPKPVSVPRPPPRNDSSASPTPPPAPAPPAESRDTGERPALQSQNALAPKKKKSKWEKQEEALDATKNKWQKFSQKANGGRASMFQSPSDASGKVGRVEKPKAKKMKRLG